MNNFEEQRKHLNSWGIATFDDLPKEYFDWLVNNISKNDPKNSTLAGHIKEEYSYYNWPKEFEDWLIDKAQSNQPLMNYCNSISVLSENLPFYMDSLWVNLQKKYEFNPLYNHSGIWSFIIPLQIPYKLEDEDVVFPKTSYKNPCASRLAFTVIEALGEILTIDVNMDQSYIGKVLMFPSRLQHMVYPFYTSDEYRITVSGNIALKV